MTTLARSALVLLSAALALGGAASAAPPGATAVPLPPPPPGTGLARPARNVLVAGKAGFSSPLGNGGDAAPMLQVEAAVPWRTARSGISLSLALPLRAVLGSEGDRSGLEFGATSLELTPTVRASLPLKRNLAFRTEAGLGVVSRWSWAQADVTFLGRRTETSQDTTALVRMGFALDWAVRPRLSVAIEPLSYGFDFEGNADWIFAAGATYRL
jgi:hypothetical protein